MEGVEQKEEEGLKRPNIEAAPRAIWLTKEEQAILRKESQNAMALFRAMTENKHKAAAEAPKEKGEH
jgi:hypothetical protein